jgi:hypothetical protein
MGDTTLALTRELAGMDLAAIGRGGEEIVTSLPWGLLWYPQSLEIPLAISALVLATVLVWVVRRRYALTLPRVAPVGGRFGCCACGRRRSQLRGVAIGAVDRPCTGFCSWKPSRTGPFSTGSRCCSPVWLRSSRCSPWYVDGWCRRPRRRHARRARRRRSACRVHPARRLRVRRAADAGRGGRCGRRCAAS